MKTSTFEQSATRQLSLRISLSSDTSYLEIVSKLPLTVSKLQKSSWWFLFDFRCFTLLCNWSSCVRISWISRTISFCLCFEFLMSPRVSYSKQPCKNNDSIFLNYMNSSSNFLSQFSLIELTFSLIDASWLIWFSIFSWNNPTLSLRSSTCSSSSITTSWFL